MYKKKYPVIIFEGIEASGKSTNINNFSKFLKKNKYQFIKIREPGGTKFSEKLRKIMLSKSCLLYTSPSPRDVNRSRMPSSA